MTLVDHALYELRRVGLFDDDADYDGQVGVAVFELIEAFARQGHSGGSAEMVIHLFNELARFKALSPLTSNPDEWIYHGDFGGTRMWQSKRQSDAFAYDNTLEYYMVLGDPNPHRTENYELR